MINITISQVHKNLKKGTLTTLDLLNESQRMLNQLKNLNAYITLLPEVAGKQAEVSQSYFTKGKPRSLLEGIPIAVKDNFCVKGVRTTCASKMLQNFKPNYTATVVDNLLQSGSVLIGKTNMDEFAMGSSTTQSIYGPTKNLWCFPGPVNADGNKSDWFISGGSSGGSAVAVAMGSCMGAIGSDTGGSVRNPASYCGVIGLKPTYGLLSRYGLIPLVNSMDVPSILSSNIEDAFILLKIMAGRDEKDSTNIDIKESLGCLNEDVSVKGLKIGIPLDYNCEDLSDEVRSTWQKVAKLLEHGGAKIIPVSMPHIKYSQACYSVLNQTEVASNMAKYDGVEFGHRSDNMKTVEEMFAESRSSGFNSIVKQRILAGNLFLMREYYEKYFQKALKVRRLIAIDFLKIWDMGCNILLTPTTLSPAPEYLDYIERETQYSLKEDYCTLPANLSGCPAVSLPIELSYKGLPLSVQLMAPHMEDKSMLEVALFIEKEVKFHQFRSTNYLNNLKFDRNLNNKAVK